MSTELITAESIDRLVDGELSPAERRALLLQLEDADGGWRRCALAFLEAQAWGREFTSSVNAPPVMLSTAQSREDRPALRVLQWLALAASLLVAFWLGGRTRSPAELPLLAADNPAKNAISPPLAVPPVEPLNPDDVMTVWARDAQGVAQPLHVPLVDADTVEKQLGVQFRPGMSPELKQQLEDRGYQVESRKRYAPLWLEQGQPLMLPVEDTRIVPVGRDIL
jgi:hypothetical protein